MAWSLEDCVQREHNFAIVDEVDSILIDERQKARPLNGHIEGIASFDDGPSTLQQSVFPFRAYCCLIDKVLDSSRWKFERRVS